MPVTTHGRVIRVIGHLDEDTVSALSHHALFMRAEDSESEVRVDITSPGGIDQLVIGFYDTMVSQQVKLRTTVFGECSAIAMIVFCAGSERTIGKNSILHFQETDRHFGDVRLTPSALQNHLKELHKTERTIAEIIASTSRELTEDDVLDLMREGRTFSASEAVQFGLAHKVI